MRGFLLFFVMIFALSTSAALAAGTSDQFPGTQTSYSCHDDGDGKPKCFCDGVSDCMKLDGKDLCKKDIVCPKGKWCRCDWKKKTSAKDRFETERFDKQTPTVKETTKRKTRDHRKGKAPTSSKVTRSNETVSITAYVPTNPTGGAQNYTCSEDEYYDGVPTCTCVGFLDCRKMKDDKVCTKNFLGFSILACDDDGCSCDWNVGNKRKVRDHRKETATNPTKVASSNGASQSITKTCAAEKQVNIDGRVLTCIVSSGSKNK